MTIDINKIATDLNGKADVDLTNAVGAMSESAKSYFSGAGMPSNNYIDLTLGTAGSGYTAPANGWFSLGGLDTIEAVANYGFVMRRDDRFGLESRIGNTAMTTGWCNGILPAKKGDVVYIYHNMVVADTQFRFIYAEGEQ